jgi:hypothetical protein
VAHDHIHLLDPDLVPEELQAKLQERLAINLQHYLWDRIRVGVGSRAHSRRGNNADQLSYVSKSLLWTRKSVASDYYHKPISPGSCQDRSHVGRSDSWQGLSALSEAHA